jgi:predicted RNase H-like HicB family nuclease
MELTVVVHEEREEFWSEVSELPGCFASGRTLDELSEAVAEAVGLYLWDVAIDLPDLLLPVGESKIQVAEPAGREPGELPA